MSPFHREGPPSDLLLIHPPAVKPAEPPLGLAVLLTHLKGQGFAASAIDANIEAYLHLLDPVRLQRTAGSAPGKALQRAIKHAQASLELLRSPAAAESFARYGTAVHHLNLALSVYGGAAGNERLTLGDYRHEGLSEYSPGDLEVLASGKASTLFAPYFQELLPRIAARNPRWVALSVNYRHQVLPAFELAGLIKRHLPGVRVAGGGGMFTSWKPFLQEAALRFRVFDRLVFGPGESALAALLRQGAPEQPYALEEASAIEFTPDYGFAPLAGYLSPRPVLPLTASRGCYWQKCLFCPEASSPTHPYAALRAEDFVPWLLAQSARYGADHIHLTDNAIPPRLLQSMAERAADLAHLRWHGFVRFEKVLLEEGLVDALAASGCRMLQLGLESGSQTVLERLGKGTRLPEVSAILKNLRRAGIATYVYIMLGTPGETREDAEATLRFLEAHAEAITFLNIAIMNLPRRSEMLARPADFGIDGSCLPDGDEPLGLYERFSPAGDWGRGEARRFLSRRLMASPEVRAIVNRTPPLFTSSHAFFFAGDSDLSRWRGNGH